MTALLSFSLILSSLGLTPAPLQMQSLFQQPEQVIIATGSTSPQALCGAHGGTWDSTTSDCIFPDDSSSDDSSNSTTDTQPASDE